MTLLVLLCSLVASTPIGENHQQRNTSGDGWPAPELEFERPVSDMSAADPADTGSIDASKDWSNPIQAYTAESLLTPDTLSSASNRQGTPSQIYYKITALSVCIALMGTLLLYSLREILRHQPNQEQ